MAKQEMVWYYLASCSTCRRIMDTLRITRFPFALREIKSEPITPAELDAMAARSGSYESLFSRLALKYRAWGLNQKTLEEKDYRKYILQEYTFLKRPVAIIGKQIFIGNAPSNIRALEEVLKKIKK